MQPTILKYLLAGVPVNLRGFLTEVSVGSGHMSSAEKQKNEILF